MTGLGMLQPECVIVAIVILSGLGLSRLQRLLLRRRSDWNQTTPAH